MPAPLIGLAAAVAPKLIDLIADTVDKAVPDKDLGQKIKAELEHALIPYFTQLLKSQSDIIIAEAKSESIIARNWRPVTMLTFVGLIVATWLGYKAPGVTPEMEVALFELVKIGLGGYVLGRSGEKIMKAYKGGG
jgi:hypothetical protein